MLEYSDGALDQPASLNLMQSLAETAAETGVMKPEDIKIRAQCYRDYLIAGKQDSFIHLSVYLLAGRTPEQKETLSISLRRTMVDLCPEVVSLSVDIRDMDPAAYKKRLK
ncbi:MAG TPA: 5-carboxymethyl-2-hydroxymuconate Delta-isomerase [Bradyrhizobium sp.]|nr:5-carboxymethyl-2-hydroxymuconate Delta-isomerase [Bradyrhizobium sp.]